MKKKIEAIPPPQPFLLTNKPPKNRQSMTACSLLRLLLRRMLYVTTHVTKEHFCKILWSKLRQGEVYKIVEYQIEIGRVRSGPGFKCRTHSLTYSEAQNSTLRLRGSKLQKFLVFYVYQCFLFANGAVPMIFKFSNYGTRSLPAN